MAKKRNPAYPPGHYLGVAKRVAWSDPTDWSDLATYGLYCLEALIQAASVAANREATKTHWDKVSAAEELHKQRGLADVSSLMRDLNEARKALAYGDLEFDEAEFVAEDIAVTVEAFFDEVSAFVMSSHE